MAMTQIRCGGCDKLLARASGHRIIEIKCPRCGKLNTERATSPEPMPNKERNRGSTDNPVDGRQAKAGR